MYNLSLLAKFLILFMYLHILDPMLKPHEKTLHCHKDFLPSNLDSSLLKIVSNTLKNRKEAPLIIINVLKSYE